MSYPPTLPVVSPEPPPLLESYAFFKDVEEDVQLCMPGALIRCVRNLSPCELYTFDAKEMPPIRVLKERDNIQPIPYTEDFYLTQKLISQNLQRMTSSSLDSLLYRQHTRLKVILERFEMLAPGEGDNSTLVLVDSTVNELTISLMTLWQAADLMYKSLYETTLGKNHFRLLREVISTTWKSPIYLTTYIKDKNLVRNCKFHIELRNFCRNLEELIKLVRNSNWWIVCNDKMLDLYTDEDSFNR